MTNSNWRTTAELLGVAAIVASLIFVGLQLRQDRQSAESENLAQNHESSIEVLRLINENREVWIAGLNGNELTEAEDITFTILAEALFKRNEVLYRIGGRLDTSSPEGRARNYAYFVYQHSGLRQKFDKRARIRQESDRAYGIPDDVRHFQGIVYDQLDELDKASPIVTIKDYVIPGI